MIAPSNKRRPQMAKSLSCRDVGIDCDFRTEGKNEDEVLKKAGEHARSVHKIDKMTPDLERKVRAAIKEKR